MVTERQQQHVSSVEACGSVRRRHVLVPHLLAEETVFLVGSDGVVGKPEKMVKISGPGTLHVVHRIGRVHRAMNQRQECVRTY